MGKYHDRINWKKELRLLPGYIIVCAWVALTAAILFWIVCASLSSTCLLYTAIGAAAAVIGSPMGILFANESNDNDSIPIAEIVSETNADFGARCV